MDPGDRDRSKPQWQTPGAGYPRSERTLREPGGLRRVVFLAFSGLVVLMLITGIGAIRALRQMHEQQDALWRDYLARSRAVTDLSSSFSIQASWIQEYSGQPETGPRARAEIARRIGEVYAALDGYPADQGPEERRALDNIRTLLEQQRRLVSSVPSAGPPSSAADVRLEPIQLAVVRTSTELRIVNDQRLFEAANHLAAYFTGLEDRLMRLLLLALGSGLALAIGSLAYISRLERQARHRYAELVDSHHEMERLSARLVEAQETERRTLSRELHDEVGQLLGALLVGMGRLAALIPGQRTDLKEEVGKLKSVAESTVQRVRNTALLLRPSMLDDLGLVAALEWLGREVSRISEVEVEVDSNDVPEDLPEEHRVCVYRLVQEALKNAARHSGARNATVSVTQREGWIEVTVTDNGCGFDTGRTRGLGILGMEERAKRLGGLLSIESAPGRGTTVTARLPIRQ